MATKSIEPIVRELADREAIRDLPLKYCHPPSSTTMSSTCRATGPPAPVIWNCVPPVRAKA
jgi:hypothetical protein